MKNVVRQIQCSHLIIIIIQPSIEVYRPDGACQKKDTFHSLELKEKRYLLENVAFVI